MIEPVEMYGATCDHCGKDWEDPEYGWSCVADEESIRTLLKESEWHIGDGLEGGSGKTYCPNCYHWDEEDRFIPGPMLKG